MGLEREVFTAHRDILSKSPKFNAQCNNEHYAEGNTKQIELPDHNPDIFTVLLEYLYKGDYWPMKSEELSDYRSADGDVRATQTQREADLYILAGYCQLWDLQQLVVEKIRILKPLSAESFLSFSKYIYDNSRGTRVYREYFRKEIAQHLNDTAVEPWIMNQIEQGGELAMDIFLAGRDSRKAEDSETCYPIAEPDAEPDAEPGFDDGQDPFGNSKIKKNGKDNCKGCNCKRAKYASA